MIYPFSLKTLMAISAKRNVLSVYSALSKTMQPINSFQIAYHSCMHCTTIIIYNDVTQVYNIIITMAVCMHGLHVLTPCTDCMC